MSYYDQGSKAFKCVCAFPEPTGQGTCFKCGCSLNTIYTPKPRHIPKLPRPTKIKDFYDSSSRWCQRAFARDAEGVRCEMNSSNACSFCLSAAIHWIYPYSEQRLVRDKIMDRINTASIADWNDTHTFEEVKALVTELNI